MDNNSNDQLPPNIQEKLDELLANANVEMARKAKNKKNQQQKNRPKPFNRFLKDKDDDTNSGASIPKMPKTTTINAQSQRTKGEQVLDLVLGPKGKGKANKYYYYPIHFQDAIQRCNDYWEGKNYEDPEHRKAWEQHNKELEENKLPKIWDPTQEAQLRDTEDFWRGMSRDDILGDTSRWEAENKKRLADGKRPLDHDRVRPWRDIPMYVPHDHMGIPPPDESVFPRTVSDIERFNDREVKFAKTNFYLTQDVDARPWLKKAYEDAKGKKDDAGKKDDSDSPVNDLMDLDDGIFKADQPSKTRQIKSSNQFAALMTSFANNIPSASNPNGTGKAENSTSANKTAAQISSVKETLKATNEMVEEFQEVTGPVPRSDVAFYLEANNCDVQSAVTLYYSDMDKPEGESIAVQSVDKVNVIDVVDVVDDSAWWKGGPLRVVNGTDEPVTEGDDGRDGKGGKTKV